MAKEKKLEATEPAFFVVGRKEGQFCWLLSLVKGEHTDDQNIELARRFVSPVAAQRAAEEHQASVFKVIDDKSWPAVLEEVPWQLPTMVPFPKCWWVTDRLLAGPAFFAESHSAFLENMDALEGAGIRSIVSLVGLDEFFHDEDQAEEIAWKITPRFSWHGFALPDGTAPDFETMQVILDWIDAGLLDGGKVFVHCLSGRGRTGTAIGCWLARHGLAHGHSAIAHLTRLRKAAGLSNPCPETHAQCARIMGWRKTQ